jgi:polysaccharide deacetylase family protein (PEP-CTERM system associated)
MTDHRIDNILSFDIEGFLEASEEVLDVPAKYRSASEEAREVEVNTMKIVEVLAEAGVRATFFILGRIARDMPRFVRTIAEAGHEIGSHSFLHRRLFNLSPDVARAAVRDSKRALEDASGSPVVGFRAPDFSIVRSNQWMFDVLREEGYVYDSSVYPIAIHDVYGIGDFSPRPMRLPNGLIEIPMSTATVMGRSVPFGGGGYFRLYPLWLTRMLGRRANRDGRPVVFYLHPMEMGEIVPRIAEMTPVRKFRTYVGVSGAADKLRQTMKDFAFVPAIDFVRSAGLVQ